MASLAEVARASGVSVSTASRALTPRTEHMISVDTRERIFRIAEELGYRPNALARGLRSRYSSTIGVIVHDIRDAYFAETARAIEEAASAAGFLTVICNTGRDPAVELSYVEQLIDYKAAGLLFVGGGLENTDYRQKMTSLASSIGSYGGGVVALGPRADRWPAEVPDNSGGAELATNHLIELGHRRIAFIDGPDRLRTTAERRLGYVQALRHADLPVREELIHAGGYDAPGGAQALSRIIDAGAKFTAVFASNDAMAMGCLQELRRRRLQVPSDVSLIGFDDVPVVRWLDPPLTTVAVPMADIGRAGVARLLDHLRDPKRVSKRRVTVHRCELVQRSSTALPHFALSERVEIR